VTFGVAVATWCGASSLVAQAVPQVKDAQVWGLQGLRAGYCVRFLIEPRAAARELRDGFLLVRADEDPTLHPALRQVIKGQPEFAFWTPSSLCFYHLDAVQLGNRKVVEKDPRNSQMLGFWYLATTEKGGARRDLVLDLYASRGALIRAAEASRVRLQAAHSVVSAVAADSVPDVYSVQVGRALLVWSGRAVGDSTKVERPLQESWQVKGLRAGVWAADLKLTPGWSRPLVGSLRVEGKGDLTKALKASPIRFVGPFYHGGGGELRFFR
jgi:hypothetical protein